MALKVNVENKGGAKLVEVKEDLYHNADRSALVPAGHEDAAFLFARAGRRVASSELEKLAKPKAQRPKKKRSVKRG